MSEAVFCALPVTDSLIGSAKLTFLGARQQFSSDLLIAARYPRVVSVATGTRGQRQQLPDAALNQSTVNVLWCPVGNGRGIPGRFAMASTVVITRCLICTLNQISVQ